MEGLQAGGSTATGSVSIHVLQFLAHHNANNSDLLDLHISTKGYMRETKLYHYEDDTLHIGRSVPRHGQDRFTTGMVA